MHNISEIHHLHEKYSDKLYVIVLLGKKLNWM